MQDIIGVLGQSKPAGATLTDLYTVPDTFQTTCSTLVICNQSASPETCRISVAADGASDSTSQYLYYDKSVPANDSLFITIGITANQSDVVRCRSASGNISFTLFGVETG